MKRVAIVGGTRTPFVKAGGVFANASFVDLGIHVVDSLVEQLKLKDGKVDELIFSTVLLDPRFPNAAREIVLRGSLPQTTSAHFVSNNCISGLTAISMAAEAIKSGRISCAIAGGSESMSRPTLTFPAKGERFFLGMARARSIAERFKLLASFRPKFVLPQPPSPKEPTTGLTMGQHCELSAQEFSIAREVQDKIALLSHRNAAMAREKGYLAQEISPYGGVEHDNLIRADTSAERLAKLPAVFDRGAKGTISAGNSSALTDGASAICLMAEDFALQNGMEILGFIDGLEFAAIDPKDGLLMAPALALPKLLQGHSLPLDWIERFEIHEAFGAQVAANLLLWERGWDKYPQATALGKIPEDKINVNGGSIAIGHPFAATGARIVLSLVNELRRSQKNTGVISICAAGAMAGAALIRRT